MLGLKLRNICLRNIKYSSVIKLLLRYASSRSGGGESELIDYLEVAVKGGKGGTGCASIQNLLKNKTKPDGGDGGSGGSVYFKSSKNRLDFSHISSAIVGRSGSVAGGRNRKGEKGRDTIIPVPIGSIIGCQESQRPLVELENEGDFFLAASGGRGGRGNQSISSEMEIGFGRYKCRDKDEGEDGDIAELYLEMKVIADIGLVGLPNAGKSSLLRSISAAQPKVASYPFTTIRPHVGVIHYDGYYRVHMADIPGLIEGSSLGYGLGISFLKHIERCKSLLYVVDMSDTECDPVKTISVLEKELQAYKPGMNENIVGVVANKIDLLPGPEPIIRLAKAFPQYPIMPISALEQSNIIAVRHVLEPFKTLYVHDTEDDNTRSY